MENPEYVENKFTKQDYHRLYETSSSSLLQSHIRRANYRDKRFQRMIPSESIRKIFYCNFNDIPLYMFGKNYLPPDTQEMITDIARWRLTIHK
jgi:hypothetical protein